MVGTIDSKGIRDILGNIAVQAMAVSGAAKGCPSVLMASTDRTLYATPAHVSATTNTNIPGRWGIAGEDITANYYGNYIVAGVAPTIDTATSGYMVIGISANGSILASAAVGSATAVQGLGRYASSLNDAAGGMMIY